MFKKLLIFLLLIVSENCFAQQADSIYSKPDIYAEFPGGLNLFLSKNLKFNSWDESEDFSSKGIYEIIIEADGKVSSFKIIKSANATFDSAVKEVTAKMTEWIPATNDGKNVRSVFRFPLQICVQ